ncbi:hypothetical protein GCM10009753_77660 [Streptantibioticus ferralitis]
MLLVAMAPDIDAGFESQRVRFAPGDRAFLAAPAPAADAGAAPGAAVGAAGHGAAVAP